MQISHRNAYPIKTAKVDNLQANEQKYEYRKIFRADADAKWHCHEVHQGRMDMIAQTCGPYDKSNGLEWADKVFKSWSTRVAP